MAHLWRKGDDGVWEYEPIERSGITLAHPDPAASSEPRADDAAAPSAVVRQCPADSNLWVLMASPTARVRVNGLPLDAGLAVLADRDDIRVGAQPPVFFSTEQCAEVEPYPANLPHGSCPRCKQFGVSRSGGAQRQCGLRGRDELGEP